MKITDPEGKDHNIIIGVDNGLDGGMCAISAFNGAIIEVGKMPTRTFFVKAKNRSGKLVKSERREVDVHKFHVWIRNATEAGYHQAKYLVEKPGGSKSAQAGISMAGSFHCLRGFFETKGLDFVKVKPTEWQRAMLGRRGEGEDTKDKALALAKQLQPDFDWPKLGSTGRGKKLHDGIIDAFLIAEWGRSYNR